MAAKAKTTEPTLNVARIDRCADTFRDALTAKDDQSNLVTRCVTRLQDEYEGFEIPTKEIEKIAQESVNVPEWAEGTKKQRASNVRKLCRVYPVMETAIEKLKAHKECQPRDLQWHGLMRLTTALKQTQTTTGKFQVPKAIKAFFENASKGTKRTKAGERKKALRHLEGVLSLQKNFMPGDLRADVEKLVKKYKKELADS